jgi:hypothetical protein
MADALIKCWHKDQERYLEKFYIVVGPYQGSPEATMEVYADWLDIDEGRTLTDRVEIHTAEGDRIWP